MKMETCGLVPGTVAEPVPEVGGGDVEGGAGLGGHGQEPRQLGLGGLVTAPGVHRALHTGWIV